MTVQLLGTLAIGAAMLIAFNQKADVKSKERPTPKMTMLAVIILSVVGLVDTYLYILDLGTFTSYIQETLTPFFGFCLMWFLFFVYWAKRGTKEALEVMLGILMGHFWWAWC
tara:strand:- start:87 stop:422 length:336 start_codon:yes stop_codon:yes gene_type:complete